MRYVNLLENGTDDATVAKNWHLHILPIIDKCLAHLIELADVNKLNDFYSSIQTGIDQY